MYILIKSTKNNAGTQKNLSYITETGKCDGMQEALRVSMPAMKLSGLYQWQAD